MKNKSLIVFALPVFYTFLIIAFNPQEVLAASTDDSFVTRFNADEMAKKHLTDFNLVRKRAIWNRGKRFVYQSDNAQVKLSIQVGLQPSAKDAEEIALNYLSYLSIVMVEGPIPGETIGNKLWWKAPNSDPNNVTSIVFIRENALFIIFSHSYKKIKELAKSIDDDIIKGESYISIENSISLPVINTISVEKNSLRKGDSSKITVNAIDPNNESLEYQFLPGLIKGESDPENMFTFIASRDHVPEPFLGSHTIKVVVINESNVVSRISEIKINCVQ